MFLAWNRILVEKTFRIAGGSEFQNKMNIVCWSSDFQSNDFRSNDFWSNDFRLNTRSPYGIVPVPSGVRHMAVEVHYYYYYP